MATIEVNAPTALSDISLTPRGDVYPSPSMWRDQVLYFLLPDRFSDGNESQHPLYDRDDPLRFKSSDKAEWMEGGKRFQGGTIAGIKSKLDYLKNLGVTTLWIAPIWKQRKDLETYHGYGIQNFLEIDPRFGTRQALRDLVDEAHSKGMYVLLDIIYNHTGNNWYYNINGQAESMADYRFKPPYARHGWRASNGDSVRQISGPEDGIWSQEFQNDDWYTRAGKIGRWDPQEWEDPLHPDNEFRRGDFFDLKDLDLNRSEVLSAVIKVYQYWIALSDCDGFRIDTVKHVPWEASRNFCGAIHEYAESIGKENFLLLGEVTGKTEMARNYLEIFGRNIDAILDIGEPPKKLAAMTKGFGEPKDFFGQFSGHDTLGSHREAGRYHVSILDDHDMVGRGKHRFSAKNTAATKYEQVAHAVGVQLTTLGIPCIYYATEQAFDGTVDNHDYAVEHSLSFEDRYIRESMFGGTFGAFETKGCHFFDQNHPSYLRIAAIAGVRNRDDQVGRTLRRGRQYLRESSVDGRPFDTPRKEELIAWSRILFDQEVLIVLNSNGAAPAEAVVTVDADLSPAGEKMTLLYRSDWSDEALRMPPADRSVDIIRSADRTAVRIALPAAGMAILAKIQDCACRKSSATQSHLKRGIKER